MLKKYFEPGALFSYRDYTKFFISGRNIHNWRFRISNRIWQLQCLIMVVMLRSLGLILAARVAAGTIFMLVGGVWADRLPRKQIMIGADTFRAATVLNSSNCFS
jgi:hypothetical protein